MKLWALLGRLDRAQRTMRFHVVASIAVLLLAIAGVLWAQAYGQSSESVRLGEIELAAIEAFESEEERLRALEIDFEPDDSRVIRYQELGQEAFEASVAAGEARLVEAAEGNPVFRVLARDAGLAFGIVAMGVALGAVWLGFGLTYIGIGVGVLAIAVPLMQFDQTYSFGLVGIGIAVLVVALLASLEGAKLLLGGGTPVLAVARNVLVEAVRARIGLIFVVALILLLAFLPVVLNEDQPLRYRVQQWIQYGLGLGYLLLAMMTVFFGVATVSFEQRDRIIWQTVSKPVRAMSYIAGKWLGVMVLNVVLMLTIAAGVFAFSVYMERLPADGEAAYHVTLGDGMQIRPGLNTALAPELRTKDRRLLEDEVLVARVGVKPDPPEVNEEGLQQAAIARIDDERKTNPDFVETREAREQILNELITLALERARTIRPGFSRHFVFSDIGFLRDDPNQPMLTLRYTYDAGTNDPADVYRLRFFFNGQAWPLRGAIGTEQAVEDGVQAITLGSAQLLTFPASLINDRGELIIEIQSAFTNGREGQFGPGNLELLYSAGGYSANFFRSMSMLLVQLGFLAAVAVFASTFLSYPVAVLMSCAMLLGTMMSGYLTLAVRDHATMTREGELLPINFVAELITLPVMWAFSPFADVKPIERLADGRLISWGDLTGAMIAIGTVSVVLLSIGVVVFRKRELALYSGH